VPSKTPARFKSSVWGFTLAAVALIWLVSQGHGCRLRSLWIEVPMFIVFVAVFPSWAEKAPGAVESLWRMFTSVVIAIGVVAGYLAWLHSDFFPGWLLLPGGG
jgi:hypothetical protein